MRVLFDTNVIIDIINKRAEFFDAANRALRLAFENCSPCVSTTTITDVIYITRKAFVDSSAQKKALEDFFSNFKILSVSKKQIKQAFSCNMADFEDAVQAYSAKKYRVKYIVTRNIKDFVCSPVPALMPVDFAKLYRTSI